MLELRQHTHANAESVGLGERLEEHRLELTAFCRRLLGPSEAEDAVQETFIRAWRSFERFEGRASLRSWLYRIATNVGLDMLKARRRRARPVDLGSELVSLEPSLAGSAMVDRSAEEEVMAGESLRLAFVAALQLPPKQRAVLILREALCWQASEVAELLQTSVASINSALQRARATLQASDTSAVTTRTLDAANGELLTRYADAFGRHDLDMLASVVRQDATRPGERRSTRATKQPASVLRTLT